jgi:hypothetical protein
MPIGVVVASVDDNEKKHAPNLLVRWDLCLTGLRLLSDASCCCVLGLIEGSLSQSISPFKYCRGCLKHDHHQEGYE